MAIALAWHKFVLIMAAHTPKLITSLKKFNQDIINNSNKLGSI